MQVTLAHAGNALMLMKVKLSCHGEHAIQEDGELYEDGSFVNGGFGSDTL